MIFTCRAGHRAGTRSLDQARPTDLEHSFEYAGPVARSSSGRGEARGIRVAQAGGVASGFASGTRRGLTRAEAVAEIRERTTDPYELSEAAGCWPTSGEHPGTRTRRCSGSTR